MYAYLRPCACVVRACCPAQTIAVEDKQQTDGTDEALFGMVFDLRGTAIPAYNGVTSADLDSECYKCKHSTHEELLLLCDGRCGRAAHTFCVGLDGVPEGDWFCSRCERRRRRLEKVRLCAPVYPHASIGMWMCDRAWAPTVAQGCVSVCKGMPSVAMCPPSPPHQCGAEQKVKGDQTGCHVGAGSSQACQGNVQRGRCEEASARRRGARHCSRLVPGPWLTGVQSWQRAACYVPRRR